MAALLTNAPRWILLAALVFAPWAYGCTRPWSIEALDAMMFAILVLWLADCAVRRMRPVIPWPLWAGALFLLVQGWLAIANPQGTYDRLAFEFTTLKQWLPFGPGVIDRVDAIPVMIRESGLLGVVCFVTDLARRPAWRTRIWWTAGLTGVALVLCGLGMKVWGYHITSYLDPSMIGWNSFAFYYYHANAGAYINIVLPLAAGLAALAFLQPHAEGRRALWLPGTVICVAGSVATLSKGAMVISLVLAVILAAWFIRRGREKGAFNLSPAGMVVTVLGAVAVLGAMLSLSWGGAMARWGEFEHSDAGMSAHNFRLVAWLVCTRMFPDSGVWGFGAGNFTIAFPHYTGDLGKEIFGVWIYAHEDYLQTIIEWGFIGAAVWAVVFFGGIWTGWRTLGNTPMADEENVLLTMALLSLAGVAAHSLFDFPLQIASIQFYTATLLGLCWGSGSFGVGGKGRKGRKGQA